MSLRVAFISILVLCVEASMLAACGGTSAPGDTTAFDPSPEVEPLEVPPDLPEPGSDLAGDTASEEAPGPPPSRDCEPCTEAAGCTAGFTCSKVGSGPFCLKDCSTNADCKAGYVCYPVSTAGKECLPMSYNCVECASQECQPGKSCDLISGHWNIAVMPCGKCTYDFQCDQCGVGSRCYTKGYATTGVCVSECPDGTCEDPAKFTCGANTDGVRICTPIKDDDCLPCPPGQVLLGDGKSCWHPCMNDAECAAKDKAKPECNPQTGLCVAIGDPVVCQASAHKCDDGKCHWCCTDADCTGRGTGKCVNYACEGVQTECEKAGIDCSSNPLYPACCVINGSAQCCGCATDDDCTALYPGVAGCACSSNMCIDPATSQSCAPIAECVAKCQSDADCPAPPSGTGTLSCKLPEGICFDPAGSCDGAAACCPPGQTCFDLLSLLFGSMGGGIPGMPGGGGLPSSGMAVCSCTTAADCLGGALCTALTTICPLPLIGTMFCPGGAPPSTAPASLCFDVSKLLGGLGGI
jgi:hypothetical protein